MRNPNGPTIGRPSAHAERGMVASPHYLASGAGVSILRRGGSAVDAAIAANAVLCVTYPHMAGLGGDAFFLIAGAGDRVEAINASGPAGSKASRAHYEDRGHTDSIPSRGPAAVLTVPGAVDGWRLAHDTHGRLAWSELFDDAIHLAEHGIAVPQSLASWYPKDAAMLRENPAASRIFLRDGEPLVEGERLQNPDLAGVFRVLAEKGPRDGFYEGEIAERLCAGVEDSPLQPSDYAEYHAQWVDPIRSTYRDLTVVEMPPNTQGFTTLQILNTLEGYDVAGWGDMTVEYMHHAAEATKLSFADRDAWLADPEYLDIPLDTLISKEYADERRHLIKSESSLVMAEVESGVSGGWSGERPIPEGDTCYLSVIDEDGLVVSLIQSIYHDFGSGVVAEGTGVIMQNRGSFFTLADDHHNRLEPGKRSFHTLIPALLLNSDGSPYGAIGSMGGEGQPQTQAAIITRLVDFGYDLQQAIEAPRWLMGRTWGAESQDLWLEGRVPDAVAHELERLGQPVKMLHAWNDNVGHAQGIRMTPGGFLEGGADPRGDGAALGF